MTVTPAMDGRRVVVTGATSGLGLPTALALGRSGARVDMVGRDAARVEDAVTAVRAAGATSHGFVADMASLHQVERLAHELAAAGPIDVLINNAGVSPGGRTLSADGYELALAVNCLAPFHLTNRLLPQLQAHAGSRVVDVTSAVVRRGRIDWDDLQLERGYSDWGAYSRSKLARLLTVMYQAEQVDPASLAFLAVHPGVVATGIFRNTPAVAQWLLKLFVAGPEKGARTQIWAATAGALAGKTGLYLADMRIGQSPAPLPAADQARMWQACTSLVDGALATAVS